MEVMTIEVEQSIMTLSGDGNIERLVDALKEQSWQIKGGIEDESQLY